MIRSNNDLAIAERTENIQSLGGNANIRATTTPSASLNTSNCPSRRFTIQFAKYFDNKSYVAAPPDGTCQCATRMYILWLVAHRDCRQTKQKEDKAAIRVVPPSCCASITSKPGYGSGTQSQLFRVGYSDDGTGMAWQSRLILTRLRMMMLLTGRHRNMTHIRIIKSVTCHVFKAPAWP